MSVSLFFFFYYFISASAANIATMCPECAHVTYKHPYAIMVWIKKCETDEIDLFKQIVNS